VYPRAANKRIDGIFDGVKCMANKFAIASTRNPTAIAFGIPFDVHAGRQSHFETLNTRGSLSHA
jgi:hypothetical protein